MLRILTFSLLILGLSSGFSVSPPVLNLVDSSVEVLVIPVGQEAFTTASINGAFLNGWSTQVGAEVYGYTATDDLWTFLNKSSPAAAYSELRIEISNLGAHYPNLQTCLQDIQSRSKLLSADCKLVLL
ncbi:MAG: hypothetical protein AB8F78_09685 [Saprospiraceae bacterium]